jgi:large subunit ribosomal protein L9
MAEFESRRSQLEATNLEQKNEAEGIAEKLNGKSFVTIRQAGDTGQLYGSVSTRDIAEAVTAGGFEIDRRQVILDRAIKSLGLHPIQIQLHPEVVATVDINVARTEDEAERQAAGEDVTVMKDEELELETFDPDADYEAEDRQAASEGEGEAGAEGEAGEAGEATGEAADQTGA